MPSLASPPLCPYCAGIGRTNCTCPEGPPTWEQFTSLYRQVHLLAARLDRLEAKVDTLTVYNLIPPTSFEGFPFGAS